VGGTGAGFARFARFAANFFVAFHDFSLYNDFSE
jgi:hypothetical protein